MRTYFHWLAPAYGITLTAHPAISIPCGLDPTGTPFGLQVTGPYRGDRFTLADCAAAPSLFYADWSLPIDERFANLRAYRQRLLSRPSFARAVDEARPYRPLFPLGAPDRD